MFRKVQNFLANRAASTKEGSTPVAFPPPFAIENPFSVFCCHRIFLLFSKVVATGLLTATLAHGPEMVLSPPFFSKAVD